MVQLLIDHGADVNATNKFGLTPLYMATAMGFVDVAALLQAHGAEGDVESTPELEEALREAAGSGDEANLAMMLEAGVVDINGADPSKGMAAVYYAAKGHHASCVALLLEHGASADATDPAGPTVVPPKLSSMAESLLRPRTLPPTLPLIRRVWSCRPACAEITARP